MANRRLDDFTDLLLEGGDLKISPLNDVSISHGTLDYIKRLLSISNSAYAKFVVGEDNELHILDPEVGNGAVNNISSSNNSNTHSLIATQLAYVFRDFKPFPSIEIKSSDERPDTINISIKLTDDQVYILEV